MTRPENEGPPQRFYDEIEARKYTGNTRIHKIQRRITIRALELAKLLPAEKLEDDEKMEDEDEEFDSDNESEESDESEEMEDTEETEEDETQFVNPDPKLILDIGCGSGLSGQVISEMGHEWIGVDISRSMLDVAVERDTDGDLIEADMGSPAAFRHGIFDGVISVSALQWLCVSNTKEESPIRRLRVFFRWLATCLRHDAIAALQFYPENSAQEKIITDAAKREGLQGGVVEDNPGSTKARKLYLVLSNSRLDNPIAKGKAVVEEKEPAIHKSRREERYHKKRLQRQKKVSQKDKILGMKDRLRRKGKKVREDTKYTGRKRPAKF